MVRQCHKWSISRLLQKTILLTVTVDTCEIEGLLIIQPRIFEDERGYFFESFNDKKFQDKCKLQTNFVQDNESFSSYGTLRGLHFQKPPYTQAKLVRVISGKVLDVVVDIRAESSTFGKPFSIELSKENKTQLYVPSGFAHGFIVLSEHALFSYKVDNYYNANSDSGILWNDFDIDWKINSEDILLSDKDMKQQLFSEYCTNPVF